MVCHPDGATLLAADIGCETVSSFAIDQDSLRVQHRRQVHAGIGPSQIVVSPSGEWIYAVDSKYGSIAVHPFDHETRQVGGAVQVVRTPHSALIIHPSGRYLLGAAMYDPFPSLRSWQIDPTTGHLSTRPEIAPFRLARSLAFSPDGNSLVSATPFGGIQKSSFDATTGIPHKPTLVAEVSSAQCVRLHSV
jgi:6-phosphogluconolactonase (cycloisomerase 2 family)